MNSITELKSYLWPDKQKEFGQRIAYDLVFVGVTCCMTALKGTTMKLAFRLQGWVKESSYLSRSVILRLFLTLITLTLVVILLAK